VLSHITGMPSANTVGLLMTVADGMIPLGGLTGQMLEDPKSPFARTQETGQTLVSISGPAALETQTVAHQSFVATIVLATV